MLPEGQEKSAAGLPPTGTSPGDSPAVPASLIPSAAASAGNAQPGEAAEAGFPTPEQIAERVYELFRRDLRVYHERKGYF